MAFHDSNVRRESLPGENMAGARPAIASCLFLVKSEIFQTKMPSYVAADISLIFPSISTIDRSLRLTVLSNWRTCSTGTGKLALGVDDQSSVEEPLVSSCLNRKTVK